MTTVPALRDYQLEAVEACELAAAAGQSRALVTLPTGTGKTVAFCELIRRRGGRALVIAHRDELLAQAESKLIDAGISAKSIGRVQAGRDEVDAEVVVASVQTLARANRRRRLGEVFVTAGPFRTVVIDEAHHSPADSYVAVLDAVSGAGTFVTDWTATPNREGMKQVFGDPVYERDLIDMISLRWLCDLRGLRVGIDFAPEVVRRSHGDYVEGDLARALGKAGAPDIVADAWCEHGEGRQTVVFAAGVQLAHDTAAALWRRGVPAEAIDGAMPLDDRQAVLDRYRDGTTQVVVNCSILTEGFDHAETSCIVVARPTLSSLLYAQLIGRGTRVAPDKDDCLILDVVGASDLHDLSGLRRVGNRSPVTLGNLAGVGLDDGTSLLDTALKDRTRRARLAVLLGEHQRIVAESVDLFGRRHLRWLSLPGLDRCYAIALGDAGHVVLVEQEPDCWAVHVVAKASAVETLGTGLYLDQATVLGEQAAYSRGTAIARVDAPWRPRPPSDKQIAFAVAVGIPADSARSLTSGQLSDLLSAHDAARKIRRARRQGRIA
ncbi:MAG: DEAD/DEAH box helicase [Limisphaerales bacterium]